MIECLNVWRKYVGDYAMVQLCNGTIMQWCNEWMNECLNVWRKYVGDYAMIQLYNGVMNEWILKCMKRICW